MISGLVSKLRSFKLLSDELSKTLGENFGHMTTALIRNESKNIEKPVVQGIQMKYENLQQHYIFIAQGLIVSSGNLFIFLLLPPSDPGMLISSVSQVSFKSLLTMFKIWSRIADCVLLLDEMSIKKQVQWDRRNSKFVGHVDYGAIKAEEAETEATNALVFMAAGLQKPWFVPVAYFLTNALNGDILKQLLIEAIKKLSKRGANVLALLFDGAPKNLGMAEKLGCDIRNLGGSFDHPSKPNTKIYVILNIYHMLKLARNAFAHLSTFCTPSGDRISWEYVLALHRTQQEDILHLGNKLKAKHVQWQNHKMKVSIAAQSLSHSVSAAITFLRNLKLPQFKDSKATSDFILLINDIFDILNSKSKFGKNYKKPISLENILDVEAYLMNGMETLKSLKDVSGVPLI